MKTTIFSIIRHALTFGAGILVAKGIIPVEHANEAVASIISVVTISWSAYENRKALMTPVPTK
jgi:hypothetical protein